MASAFYLGKRFTVDPERLDAALTGAEAHHAGYRELSDEEQGLRRERQLLHAKIKQIIEANRLSSHVIDPDGGRVLREPLSEEVRCYQLDADIAKLAARKAIAAEAVQAHGRLRDAAREHAQKAGILPKPLSLGYIPA